MFCRMPYNSILIQPDGKLSMCCSQSMKFDYGHISTTPDLAKAWKESKNALNIKNLDSETIDLACGNCLKEKEVLHNRWTNVNTLPFWTRIPIDDKIRFLEFTTSNICNQTCVTCSSFFSSKWKNLEQEAIQLGLPLNEWKNGTAFNSFGNSTHRLTDSDIEKIFPLLPDLHMLHVKGGEPFADNNNYAVLKELFRVNPECIVLLTSNMSSIPEKYLKLLSGKKVGISCSIDGVGQTYEYVRSTKFENTIENLKRLKSYKLKGQVSVSITASMHNMYNLNEMFEYWQNNMMDEVAVITLERNELKWARQPYFISPAFIMNQKQIDEYYSKYLNDFSSNRISKLNLYKLKSENILPSYRAELIKRFHLYTRFMNINRGINIYDIHPQLKEL